MILLHVRISFGAPTNMKAETGHVNGLEQRILPGAGRLQPQAHTMAVAKYLNVNGTSRCDETSSP